MYFVLSLPSMYTLHCIMKLPQPLVCSGFFLYILNSSTLLLAAGENVKNTTVAIFR